MALRVMENQSRDECDEGGLADARSEGISNEGETPHHHLECLRVFFGAPDFLGVE